MTVTAGKTVVLTGASRGIGAFIARALAREKATVVCISRSPEKLAKICTEIDELGGKGISFPYDLSQVDSLSVLVDKIQQQVGAINILINNAGIEIYREFSNYTLAELQSVLSTNLLATMELTRLVLPSMLDRGTGQIVNMASTSGKKGAAYNSIYSASKGGLVMWSDALRQELTDTGVGVTTICPGYVCGQGMTADSGVPIPSLAGMSTPEAVTKATLKAIALNQAEVIINQDLVTEITTKLLFALGQISPRTSDRLYRKLGIAQSNQLRISRGDSRIAPTGIRSH
jgi:short-subunit dehydrogenase